MILPKFTLLEPTTIQSACAALRSSNKARLMAGGTDLLVDLKKKRVTADVVVSLEKITRLKALKLSATKLTIGSMATIAEIAESPGLKAAFPVLSAAAGKLGSIQVRNRATVGGNICTASPAGDTLGPLVAYDASVRIEGPQGARQEPLQSVFLGPGKTSLAAEEILTAVTLKIPAANTGGSYVKYGTRNAMEIGILTVTCLVSVRNGKCRSARIVLGAAGPTVLRCTEAEELLVGKAINEDTVKQAAKLSAAAAKPSTRTGARASTGYRRELVSVLVTRGLLEAAEKAAK